MRSEISPHVANGFLTTYWPGAICLLVFVILASWFMWRRRRLGKEKSGKQKAGNVVIAVVSVLALALGIGAIANAISGYFPTVSAMQRWASGNHSNVTLPLDDTGKPKTTDTKGFTFRVDIAPDATRDMNPKNAWVYVPPTYDFPDNDERYPTVILMHGAPGRSSDWFGGGQADLIVDSMIANGDLPPMIVIASDGSGGDFGGRKEPFNRPGGPQVEDYITEDIVDWADDNLRTIPDADHRAIGGMSAGGIGALVFGLHSPETFSGVISLLPYTEPYTKEVTSDVTALMENSPLALIANMETSTDQKFFLGQGTGESTKEIEEIATALQDHGATVKVELVPKLSHNWIAARTLLPVGLKWVSQELDW